MTQVSSLPPPTRVSKFTAYTNDSHDQPPPIQHHVSAKLKSLVDHGSVLQATVVSQFPSMYELSYTPTTTGRHQLTVGRSKCLCSILPLSWGVQWLSLRECNQYTLQLMTRENCLRLNLVNTQCLMPGGLLAQLYACFYIPLGRGSKKGKQQGELMI